MKLKANKVDIMGSRRRQGEAPIVSLTVEETRTLIRESIHEVLDEILEEKLTPVTQLVASLRVDLDKACESVLEVRNTAEEAKVAAQGNSTKMAEMESTINRLTKQTKDLQDKVISMECHSRRDNLCFGGIPESAVESDQQCEEKVRQVISELMNIDTQDIKFVRCHRLGPRRANTTRSIIIKFHYYGDRQLVWSKRSVLRGKTVWVSENFPSEIEKRRALLRPIWKEAKQMAEYRGKAFINVDKLVLNGQSFSVDQLHRLPEKLQPENVATKTVDDKYVCFWSRDSIFSNFYKSPFVVGDKTYSCVEQYVMYQKALLFDDGEKATDIMEADDPATHKALGYQVTNFDLGKWRQEAPKIVMDALQAKFDQHPRLKAKLLETRGKELVETSPSDRFWGIGIRMSDPAVKDKSKWGQNRLGKLLMELRDNF